MSEKDDNNKLNSDSILKSINIIEKLLRKILEQVCNS